MRIIVVVMLILQISDANAQLTVDLSSGISLSNVDFQNSEVNFEFDHVTYFFAGVSLRYELFRLIGVCLENQIDFRGYEISGSNDLKYRRMYWNIIPTVQLELWRGLNMGLGIYYGLLLRDEYQGVASKYRDIKNLETISDADSGMAIELKYLYSRLGVRVIYKHGIMNIDNRLFHNINGMSIGGVKHKSRELQMGICYRLIE